MFLPPNVAPSEPVKEVRILLQGAAGTGKTHWISQFPNLIVLDMDHKCPVLPHVVSFWNDEVMKSIKGSSKPDKIINWCRDNLPLLTPDTTVAFDSWSTFQMFVDEAANKECVGDKDGFRFYRLKLSYSAAIINIFRALKCRLIVTAHETTKGANITQMRPLMEGKFGDQLDGHFTDHYRSFITNTKENNKTTEQYNIALAPDAFCDCFTNPELGPRIRKAGVRSILNTYAAYEELFKLPK